MKNPHNADWKGALERQFRWSSCRWEFGRMCYQTDCTGEVSNSWWEWERP